MSNIFYNIEPKVINTKLACLKEIGLNGAIVLQQLHYWIDHNRKLGKNFQDGRYWTYGTVQEYLARDFPFWSLSTVRRILEELDTAGFIVVGNYNKLSMDRTKWYTINYEAIDALVSPSPSGIFYDYEPKLINTELACIKAIGLNGAIVLQQLYYWLDKNEKAGRNLHDGRFWTYGTIAEYNERDFPFWKFDVVKDTFKNLEKKQFLFTGNYNNAPMDRTKWYSINHEAINTLAAKATSCRTRNVKAQGEIRDKANNPSFAHKAPMQEGDMSKCNRGNCTIPFAQKALMQQGDLNQCNGSESPIAFAQNPPLQQGDLSGAIPEIKPEINHRRLEQKTNTQKSPAPSAAGERVSANAAECEVIDGEVVSLTDLLFEKFWELYPRQQSKQKAKKEWDRINPDQALFDLIANALEYRKKTSEWRNANGRYIPYPEKWLKDRRWEDSQRPLKSCGSDLSQDRFADMTIDGKPIDPAMRKGLEHIEKRLKEMADTGEVL